MGKIFSKSEQTFTDIDEETLASLEFDASTDLEYKESNTIIERTDFKESGRTSVVAAIQIGWTHSLWAMSFCPRNCIYFNRRNEREFRAPNSVLIRPDGKTFEAFGSDAEKRYNKLLENGDYKEWYYFRRFTLTLLHKPINNDTILESECGKTLPALTVFSLVIRYIVGDIIHTIQSEVDYLKLPDEIHWVLTVPATWDDSAVCFMELASQQANQSMKKLTVVSELVAASSFCRDSSKRVPGPGQKYLVLNAAECYIDITVHEECPGSKLKELNKTSARAWEGTMVDRAFVDFLEELIGADVLKHFKDKHTDDYHTLLYNLERKIEFSESKADFTRVLLPWSIIKLVKDIRGQSMKDIIAESQYAKRIKLRPNAHLCMDDHIWQSFFRQSIDIILKFLSTVLWNTAIAGVETIFMVGCHSTCPLLQEAVRKEFPKMKVIVPHDALLGVIKGAVIFGHSPLDIDVLKESTNVCMIESKASRHEDLGNRSVQCDDHHTGQPTRPAWSVLPPHWVPMKADELFKKVCLPIDGDEFKSVSTNFQQTLDNRDILSIQRIQSKFLWEQFCVKRKEMETINGIGGAEERILFHGTKSDIIEDICTENLDVRLAGTNSGNIYGLGTYFATSARISENYATPDCTSGRRYMLQCRVLVGKWTKGEQLLKRPPEITTSTPSGYRRRYNSCVDNILKPTIFCIFDHVQYYPEYIIEFE